MVIEEKVLQAKMVARMIQVASGHCSIEILFTTEIRFAIYTFQYDSLLIEGCDVLSPYSRHLLNVAAMTTRVKCEP